MNIQYYHYKDTISDYPFQDLETNLYNNDSKGIVIHYSDLTVIKDNNTHVYYDYINEKDIKLIL